MSRGHGGASPSPCAMQNHAFASQAGGACLLCHTAEVSAVSHGRTVCLETQQTCLLARLRRSSWQTLLEHIAKKKGHICIYIYIPLLVKAATDLQRPNQLADLSTEAAATAAAAEECIRRVALLLYQVLVSGARNCGGGVYIQRRPFALSAPFWCA